MTKFDNRIQYEDWGKYGITHCEDCTKLVFSPYNGYDYCMEHQHSMRPTSGVFKGGCNRGNNTCD